MTWKQVWPAVVLAAAVACGDPAGQAPPAAETDRAVGGYGPGDLSQEGAKTALALVETAIYERYPSRAMIETVELETQLVAGLNYRFRIEMSGAPESRAIYEAVVYRDLDDNYEITSLNRLQ